MTETGSEIALENEIHAEPTGARIHHVEALVGHGLGIDATEADLVPDGIGLAHGPAERTVGLEADHDPSMITTNEADLEDASEVVLALGW